MARTPRAEFKAIQDLIRSRGWGLVREVMEREIVEAAMAIANDPRMSLDEINFRRGAIWAAHQLLDLPGRLGRKIEADMILTEAMASRSGQDDPDPVTD
jgi:hypothetical protein